ncbi:MAG TPA: RNA polymerase sigma factor [Gemmataceae bacterium]|nr:RNA polymerase sigma factor [Gemmataceae bacterium]
MKNGLRKALDHLWQSSQLVGLTDGQLLKSFIVERDELAFSALVRRHGPMVFGVCRRILRNTHDTEDAFQATFLVLVQKASSVVNRQAIASWLYTVAFRSALEARVRSMRRQQKERQVPNMPHPEVATTEPHDWQPLLDQELNRLAEKYRLPVILCDLELRPRREVARQLGLAEGTLSSRLARGRRLLAERLTRRGVVLSGGALAAALAQSASAAVPQSLLSSTVQTAILVAAGEFTTPAAILSKGVLKVMFMAKLKAVVTSVVAILVLGVGSLVCSAGGGQSAPQGKPPTELDALRKENELLKVNLRVTLEKIQTLEAEIHGLKEQAAVGQARTLYEGYITSDINLQNSRISDAVAATLQASFITAVPPDPALQVEAALRLLRQTGNAESRKRALDQLEKATKKLREQVGKAK